MAFIRANFVDGTLASGVSLVATSMTLKVDHNFPIVAGSFRVVVYDPSYQYPADDPSIEVVEASYSGTVNVYNIVRAQEGTVAAIHSIDDVVAMFYTAGVSQDDLTWLGSYQVDETGVVDSMVLNLSSGKIKYTSSPVITGLTLTGFSGVLQAIAGVVSGGATIDVLGNLAVDKTFNNGAHSISFNFTNPSNQPTYDGAFEIQASGAFTGDLLHVHQHTGNPGAVDLCHFEANDPDVVVLKLTHSGAGGTCLSVWDGDSENASILETGVAAFAGLTVDTDVLVVDVGNNRVGINTASPERELDILGNLGAQITRNSVNASAPTVVLRKIRGAATAVALNDFTGVVDCRGWDGDSYIPTCYFGGKVDGAVSDQNVPQAFIVATGTAASASEKFRITSAGLVLVNKTSGTEQLEVNGKIRADTAFNVNGSDGASATYTNPSSLTVLGGIITAGASGTTIVQRTGAADDYVLASFTRDGAWHDLDLSSILPAGALHFWCRTILKSDAASKGFSLRAKGTTGSSDAHHAFTQVANVSNYTELGPIGVDANRVCEYNVTNETGFAWNIMTLTITAYK